MKKTLVLLTGLAMLASPAYAINAKYRQQLEQSGCTQVSEAQGCDIHKSKAENAKAGFDTGVPAAKNGAANYKQQLQQSGCTQVSEAQGCDIHKSREENARAGFGPQGEHAIADRGATPYAGQWVAKTGDGTKVATIRVDAKNQVWVNGKKVKAKKSDGGLSFRDGTISYFIQGDRRLKDEDTWTDNDAGTKGLISAE